MILSLTGILKLKQEFEAIAELSTPSLVFLTGHPIPAVSVA